MTGESFGPIDDGEGERRQFARRCREVRLSTERFINVVDGTKKSHDHAQVEPDSPRLSGNYGIYAGPGADGSADVWLVDVDVDDYNSDAETAVINGLAETLTVETPHTDGETGGHRFYAVTGDVVAAMKDATDTGAGGVSNPSPSWGEIRVANQYVVGPGSQIEKGEEGCDKDWCDECAKPDGGHYRIARDVEIATITADELADVVRADPAYADGGDENNGDLGDYEGDGTDADAVARENRWIADYLALGADDRSKKDHAVCRAMIEHGVDEADTRSLLESSSRTKVSERGRDYWRSTWTSARKKATPPQATADGGTATAGNFEHLLDGANDHHEDEGIAEAGDVWSEIRAVLANDDRQNEPARYQAYKLVREAFHFATFLDTEELYVYDPETGVYDEGGEATVREWLEGDHRLGDQFKRSEANEIIYRIKSATFRDRAEFGGDEYDPKVCVENGVLDLAEFADPTVDDPEVRFLDHSPAHLLLTRVPVAYDPDADCGGFDGFLDNVLAKDADKALIYEMIGYCLWPDYPFAKALFLYGDGRNGKSTLLDVWKQFLGGDENVSSRGLYELEMQRFASSALYGRLANIAGDLPDQELSRTGTFKTLTGGDLVTAEKKYQDAFSFKNRAKLVFSANDPPKIEDDTTAMYRRLLLVNFPNEFTPEGQPGPDARPKHELLAEIANDEELSGLLNRALAGLVRVFARGRFSQNETVDQVREQYKRVSDPIYAFSKECVRTDPEGHVATDRLYNVYSAWARENEAPVKDKSVFPRKLATHLKFEKGKAGGRGNQQRVYQGIVLSDRGELFIDAGAGGDEQQSYLG